MQYSRSDARHPQFGTYVASGEKARDVYAAMTREIPVTTDEQQRGYLEDTSHGMVRLQLESRTGYVYIQRLSVPGDQRGHGIGEAVLGALCVVADRRGWTLTATPSVDLGASSVARLQRWAVRHGFVRNRRGRRDFDTQASMVRPVPQRGGRELEVAMDALARGEVGREAGAARIREALGRLSRG